MHRDSPSTRAGERLRDQFPLQVGDGPKFMQESPHGFPSSCLGARPILAPTKGGQATALVGRGVFSTKRSATGGCQLTQASLSPLVPVVPYGLVVNPNAEDDAPQPQLVAVLQLVIVGFRIDHGPGGHVLRPLADADAVDVGAVAAAEVPDADRRRTNLE